jgi:serine/threonine protein kinase
MSNITVHTKSTGKVTLDKQSYIGAGGEGSVYVKNDIAFKIYHDPSKMIPTGKVLELEPLKKIPNVLGPLEPIFDSSSLKTPIGFTMKYVRDTEYLTKLFTSNFRTDNSITPTIISELVMQMQKTLEDIHSKNIVVGDYNEMNFLIDKDFKIPYHIDVDSWQTPSFKSKVISLSIADYSAFSIDANGSPSGNVSQSTDWYAFAVIALQLYTGLHPFRGGVHPTFKPKEWIKRAKNNISVFNSQVQLPSSCQDFSVIPKMHLDWLKGVFEKNDRSKPPVLGKTFIAASSGGVHVSTDKFIIDTLIKLPSKILDVYHFEESFDVVRYLLTEKGFYKNTPKSLELITPFTQTPKKVLVAKVLNSDPVLSKVVGNSLIFFDSRTKEIISTTASEGCMAANGAIYTADSFNLVENTFEKRNKVLHSACTVSSLNPNSFKMFPGVVMQDVNGKCLMTIPFELGSCSEIWVPEINGHRIIDAKYSKRFCIIISEKGSIYYRHLLQISKDFSKYVIKTDDDVELNPVNFVVRSNGLCINAFDDYTAELFEDFRAGIKEIKNPPFNTKTKLFTDSNRILFAEDKNLYDTYTRK